MDNKRKSPTNDKGTGYAGPMPYNYGAPMPPGPPGHHPGYYNHPPMPPNMPPNQYMYNMPPQQYGGGWPPQRSPPPQQQQPIFRGNEHRPSPPHHHGQQWGYNQQRPPSPMYGGQRSPNNMDYPPYHQPPSSHMEDMICKSATNDIDGSSNNHRVVIGASMMDKKDDKGRGSYRCGRCGVPKKGHVCPYQPKLKRRPEEGPPPDMKSMSTQVEMDEHMILRRLNMEIQGYPESYMSDINDMVVGAESSNMPYPQQQQQDWKYHADMSPVPAFQGPPPPMDNIANSNGSIIMEDRKSVV